MECFNKIAAWTLICFGAALVILGALATPEFALADGGNPQPCINACYGSSSFTSCDQSCQSQCNGDPTCYSNCMQSCGDCVGVCCMNAGATQAQCCNGPCNGNQGCYNSCLAAGPCTPEPDQCPGNGYGGSNGCKYANKKCCFLNYWSNCFVTQTNYCDCSR
jgi:hypothetical protein